MSNEQPPSGAESPSPHLRARVPDDVAGGTFSTGAIVITGPSEFVIDFLQTVGRPHRVAARVIIPHVAMPQFVEALRTNLKLYRDRFGDIPAPPTNEGGDRKRPTPQEIYDDLKLPDEVLSGVYANGIMIGHGPSEFGLDFLTSFFPQSAVSARVFLSCGQVPRLLDSLQNALDQLRLRNAPSPKPAPPSFDTLNPPTEVNRTEDASEQDSKPLPPQSDPEPSDPENPGLEDNGDRPGEPS